MPKQTSFKYLVCSGPDRLWGITVDTVGEYSVEPGYTVYPPPSAGHPDDYYFNVDRGRILDNYQLIYITQGRGWYKDTGRRGARDPGRNHAYHSALHVA